MNNKSLSDKIAKLTEERKLLIDQLGATVPEALRNLWDTLCEEYDADHETIVIHLSRDSYSWLLRDFPCEFKHDGQLGTWMGFPIELQSVYLITDYSIMKNSDLRADDIVEQHWHVAIKFIKENGRTAYLDDPRNDKDWM